MSENPYKGVPGGDPRLRVRKEKKIVLIEFICSKCNQTKKEKLPEGKDTTGRVCVDCRNAEGVLKQKAQQEEADKRWAEYTLQQRTRPNRTEEEMLALLEEWKDAHKEQCRQCGGSFFVASPLMPFYNDSIERPNAIMTVSYTCDPYEYEIRNREVEDWYCKRCYKELAYDI